MGGADLGWVGSRPWDVDDVDRFKPARDPNGRALVGELVDDVSKPLVARDWNYPRAASRCKNYHFPESLWRRLHWAA